MHCKFAIDLTWLRHKVVGGAESYILNLLYGMHCCSEEFDALLITTQDNNQLFDSLSDDSRFSIDIVPFNASSVKYRVYWQNFKIKSYLKRKGFAVCFTCGSFFSLFDNKTCYVSVVHDLQSIHFPEYHSFLRRIWNRINWYNAITKPKAVIAISDYVNDDIKKQFRAKTEIKTVYNPIRYPQKDCVDDSILKRLGVSEGKYYFTISKLNSHKNLQVLIKVFSKLKEMKEQEIPLTLVISGVNGSMSSDLNEMIEKYDIGSNVILTGFVSEEEKNSLYKHAYAFLFPSIFEGFGMPLVEAMFWGIPVITTCCTSIPEVTQNKANYVSDPYSTDEWIIKMKTCTNHSLEIDFSRYQVEEVGIKYLHVIKSVCDMVK